MVRIAHRLIIKIN